MFNFKILDHKMKFLNKNRFPRKKVSRICLILEHIFFVNQFEKSNKMKQEKSNTDSILQTSRSTKAASRESRKPDSESRQLDGTVSSVKDTESSVKNTESSVRSTTGRVRRQESTSRSIQSQIDLAPQDHLSHKL